MVKFSLERSVSVNKHNGAIYTCRRCDQIFCEKITFCRYKNRKGKYTISVIFSQNHHRNC